MTDRCPSLEKAKPGKLLLTTAGTSDLRPEHLLEAFGEQRCRFAAVLQGFGPDDWAAPTRCADWSAHRLSATFATALRSPPAPVRMTKRST